MTILRRTRGDLVRVGLAASGISLAVVVGATTVVTVMGWPGAAGRSSSSPARPSNAQDALRAEIDAMLAAGFAPDDPKVQLLEDELAALQALEVAEPVPEPAPEPDPGGNGERPQGGTTDAGAEAEAEAGPGAGATELWDDGPVECEPIPQQLTVEDIAGATCYVEPRTDGTVRYVAVAPDGREREVIFGTSAGAG